MTHCSFKLTLGIAAPFSLNSSLTLDGLLSYAVNRATGLRGAETIDHIPLVSRDGIFLASSLFCHAGYQHINVGRVMKLRPDKDLSMKAFYPNGRNRKSYVAVDQKRGPYKANMDSYPGIAAREVYFWGVGDTEKIVGLIDDYVLGIGKRANAGAGEIIDIRCDEIDEDFSWMTAKGLPARPLPLSIWKKIGGKELESLDVAVTLPYWEVEAVKAVVPVGLVA